MSGLKAALPAHVCVWMQHAFSCFSFSGYIKRLSLSSYNVGFCDTRQTIPIWELRIALQACQAAIRIQSGFRGHSTRLNLKEQGRAATLIQSCWRTTVQMREYARLLRERQRQIAAIQMQRMWRGFQVRVERQRQLQAACRIQAAFRIFLMKRRSDNWEICIHIWLDAITLNLKELLLSYMVRCPFGLSLSLNHKCDSYFNQAFESADAINLRVHCVHNFSLEK